MATTTIPIELIDIDGEGYHLCLLGKINGNPVRLILDTGASQTVLDRSRVDLLVEGSEYELHDKLTTGLGTNSMESHRLVIPDFSLGEICFYDRTFILLDLSHINSSYETLGLLPIDGVLGSDILVQGRATIDLDKMQIILAK